MDYPWIFHGLSMDIHGKIMIFHYFPIISHIISYFLTPLEKENVFNCYSWVVDKSSPQEFARPWSGPGQHGVFLRSPKRRRHAGTSQKAYIFKKVFFFRSPKRRRHAVTSQKAFMDYPWIFHGISMNYPWIFH